MKNDYGSLIESRKVDLIIERAKRKRFRRDELEDVQQEIVPDVLGFEYDPTKANGLTEATVLTLVIDKKLTFLQRGNARQHRHEQNYREQHGAVEGRPASIPYYPSHEHGVDLATDVGQTVAGLTSRQQAVCAALSNSQSRVRIANRLHMSRYKLDCIIEDIRRQFETIGFDDWMCE